MMTRSRTRDLSMASPIPTGIRCCRAMMEVHQVRTTCIRCLRKLEHFYFCNNFGKDGTNFIFSTVEFRMDMRRKLKLKLPVMWSENVGLRTRPVSDQKKSVLVLVLQVWCCFVKHSLVTIVLIMILNDPAT